MKNNSFDSELHEKIYEESFHNKTFKLDPNGFKTLFPSPPRIGQDLKIGDRYFRFIGQWNFKEFYLLTLDSRTSNYQVKDGSIFIGEELSEPMDLIGFHKIHSGPVPGIEKLLNAPLEFSCVVCSNEGQLIEALSQKIQNVLVKKKLFSSKFQEIEIVCDDLYKSYIDKQFYDLIDLDQNPRKIVIKDLDDFFDNYSHPKSSREFKQFLNAKKFICFVAAASFFRYKKDWRDLVDELVKNSKSIVFFWELETDQEFFILLEEKWNLSFISLDVYSYLHANNNIYEQEQAIDLYQESSQANDISEYPYEFSDILLCNFEHSLVFISNRSQLLDALCYKVKILLTKRDYLNSAKEFMIVGRNQEDIDFIRQRLEQFYSSSEEDYGEIELCSIDSFINTFTEIKNLKNVAAVEKLSSSKKVVFFFDCLNLFASQFQVVEWLKDLFCESKTIVFLWEFYSFKKNLKLIQTLGFMHLAILLLTKIESENEKIEVENNSVVASVEKVPEVGLLAAENKVNEHEHQEKNPEPECSIPDLYSPPIYINNHAFLLQLNKDLSQLEVRSYAKSRRRKKFYGPIFIGLLLMIIFIVIGYFI